MLSKRISIRIFWFAILAAVLVQPVLAAEGRTPIWQQTVITQSGKYILTRNVNVPVGVAVDIQANGVDLDLNGFILGAPGSPNPVIQSSGFSDLHIHNGTVNGGTDAVYIRGAKNVVVEGLQINSGTGTGIFLDEVTDITVRNNQIRDRNGIGILANPGAAFPAVTGLIADNVVEACQEGISVDLAQALVIRNNQVQETFGSFGIRVFDSRSVIIAENTTAETLAEGIWLEITFGSKVYNNTVSRAHGPAGIHLLGSHENLVLDNVVNECDSDGIAVVGDRNLIQRNNLSRNGATGSGFGLHLLGQQNVWRENMARSNPGPAAACPGFPATNDVCDSTAANTTFGDNFMPGLI